MSKQIYLQVRNYFLHLFCIFYVFSTLFKITKQNLIINSFARIFDSLKYYAHVQIC